MHKPEDKYRTGFVYLGLIVLTLAVYWQVREFEFTNYDDNRYVSTNSHISTGLKWENVIWVFTHEHGAHWHPLTGLSHILDCELFGLNPGPPHLVNLLFHIVNTLLLFTVLRRVTGAFWQIAFVACLFAIHPMNVETVAWISERKNVLSTLFWILTMAAYFRYVKNQCAGRYILTAALFVLGLMSKPMLVTMPFVLLLLDYWPLNRLEINGTGKINWRFCRYLIWEKIPFFIMSAAVSIVTFSIHESGGYIVDTAVLPLTMRISSTIVSYARYIQKMIWPVKLAMLYPYHYNVLPLRMTLIAGILLLIITALVIRFGAKLRYLPVGWFWYIGTLVPVIGLVQVCGQAMADRYSYVPFIGLFIMVAWGANDLLRKWRYRQIALGVLSTAIILILSVDTHIQAGYWHDNMSLYKHALKVTCDNYNAHYGFGLALLGQNKLEEAANQFKEAVIINPNHDTAWYDLGVTYGKLGSLTEAIYAYKQVIELKPDYAYAYYDLGILYGELGRWQDEAEACQKVIKIKPDFAEAYGNFGAACNQLGRYEEAISAFKEAIRLKPDYAEAYNNLGAAYLSLGRYDELIEFSRQAVKAVPDYPLVYNNLGAAYYRRGRYPEAVDSYKRAIKLKPNYTSAHYNLGLTFVKTGENNAALEEYEILKTLDAQEANKLLNLIHK